MVLHMWYLLILYIYIYPHHIYILYIIHTLHVYMYISLGICMYVHARYLVDVYVLYVRRWCIHSMHQVSESQILIRNTVVHVPSHVNIIIQC